MHIMVSYGQNNHLSGDVKIEYDYTRTDHETRCVNILYIQATGDEEDVYEKDISKWSTLTRNSCNENLFRKHECVSY